MALRRLLTQVGKQHLKHQYRNIGGSVPRSLQERFQSSYVGRFTSRFRDTAGSSHVAMLEEFQRSDPERAIRMFESQPSLHSNPSAVEAYVKALVRADRLEGSSLLWMLQRG